MTEIKNAFEIVTPTPIKGEWVKPSSNGYKKHRKWQKECFNKLKNECLRIINVPMGAGKSVEMVSLAHEDLKNNPKLKAILAVPQLIIAEGFLEENKIELPDKSKISWCILENNNLIDNSNCLERFISFLKMKPGNPIDIMARCLVCSHSTLALAYTKLKEENNLHLLKNVSLFIDEAHHVCGYVDEQFDANESNILGGLANDVASKNSNKLTLATATFFRGDKIPIFSQKIMDKFVSFRYPYDQYLKDMIYLRSFSFNFVFYSDTNKLIKSIQDVFENDSKSIVYLPPVNSSCCFGEKNESVKMIFDAFNIDGEEEHDGAHRGIYNGRNLTAIDLVDNNANRKRRMSHIHKHNHHSLKDVSPDLIVALNMFKEGANYVHLNHGVIIGPRNSLTDMVQMIGRTLRDVEGKESVSIYQFLPMSISFADGEERREAVNDNLKAIIMSMMMENVLSPSFIIKKDKKSSSSGNHSVSPGDAFSDLIPDINERNNLLSEIIKEAVTEEANTGKGDYETSKKIIESVLAEKGYTEDSIKANSYDIEDVVDQIFVVLARRSIKMEGIDVSEIDIELVKEIHMLDWLLPMFSGDCTIDTFDKIRDILKKRQDDVKNNKKLLLNMPVGCERPNKKTKLGNCLSNYIRHDPVFDQAIRVKHPQWFVDSALENKKQLLDMPIECERPSQKTELGQRLSNYIGKISSSYDYEFDQAIRAKHPQWFVDSASENKKKLLDMPVGCKRPNNKTHQLGRVLSFYTSRVNSCYDREFDKAIHAKHPQWFVDSALENKKQLLDIPVGSDKPNSKKTKLGQALQSYISKSSGCYDLEFDQAIRAKHPQWFVYSASENKKKLLDMPVGCKRPGKNNNLGIGLCGYINEKSGCYDLEFNKLIREKHPQWFINTSLENKKKLLDMPIGCKRPIAKDKIGSALCCYTNKKRDTYDPEFDKAIRAKQPGWFK